MTLTNPLHRPLPHEGAKLFITDGGLETTLIFQHGLELREFSTLDLLAAEDMPSRFRDYYVDYLNIAKDHGLGFVLETPTWRASPGWANMLGYDEQALEAIHGKTMDLMHALREEHQSETTPIVISGNIGPRGDGYTVADAMTPEEAANYHDFQVRQFATLGADLVSAITLNYAAEAAGIVLAGNKHQIPVVIAFTTETDGRLPDGTSLEDAIRQVDDLSDGGPAYYMINCAHPEHFDSALENREPWVQRIRGLRANASRMSHEELDAAEELDAGDPQEFGSLYQQLFQHHPHFTVIGGCCGTDHRHVGSACRQVLGSES